MHVSWQCSGQSQHQWRTQKTLSLYPTKKYVSLLLLFLLWHHMHKTYFLTARPQQPHSDLTSMFGNILNLAQDYVKLHTYKGQNKEQHCTYTYTEFPFLYFVTNFYYAPNTRGYNLYNNNLVFPINSIKCYFNHLYILCSWLDWCKTKL